MAAGPQRCSACVCAHVYVRMRGRGSSGWMGRGSHRNEESYSNKRWNEERAHLFPGCSKVLFKDTSVLSNTRKKEIDMRKHEKKMRKRVKRGYFSSHVQADTKVLFSGRWTSKGKTETMRVSRGKEGISHLLVLNRSCDVVKALRQPRGHTRKTHWHTLTQPHLFYTLDRRIQVLI